MKQPILDGILESPLDLNGFGFVNIGGLLGTFEVPLMFSAPFVRSVNTISMPVATASVDGYLAHGDWTIFNSKQAALGFVPAPVASPVFTGTPLAPTATAETNTTQIATTAFVVSALNTAVSGLLSFKGTTDCSGNPNYPSASKGDSYIVSVAGKIGGASGTVVGVGDWYIAQANNAGGTEAAVGASWAHLQHSLAGALLASNNLSDLASASTARTNLGLGTLATLSGTFSGTSSGTNTGDQVVPVNTTATASNWFTAYNSATGAFTKARPTFTDLAAHPTTISGYGITDFNSLGDARWQPLASALTSWAAITRAAGFDTFTATPTVAHFKSLLSDETTVAGSLLSLANPGAISFIKIAADNSVSTRTPSQLLSDISAGGIDSDGNSIHLNPSGANLANIVISNPLAYARLVYDTTYVSVENGRINFVAPDPPTGQGFRFNTYNVKFGTGGTVQYQDGVLDFAGFSSTTGSLNAPLWDGTQLSLLPTSRRLIANDGSTVALDWSDPTQLGIFNGILMYPSGIIEATHVSADAFDGDGSGLTNVAPGVGSIGSVIAGTKTATGTATTTFTVTIGVTMANTTYKVTTEGDNALSAAVHYVNNKTTTSFDIVYLAGLTGPVSIDWIVSP